MLAMINESVLFFRLFHQIGNSNSLFYFLLILYHTFVTNLHNKLILSSFSVPKLQFVMYIHVVWKSIERKNCCENEIAVEKYSIVFVTANGRSITFKFGVGQNSSHNSQRIIFCFFHCP